MKSTEIKDRAKQNDISMAALRRAKRLKKIIADREGGKDGYWYWHFPDGYFDSSKDDHKGDQAYTIDKVNTLNSFNENQADKGFKGAQQVKEAQGAQDLRIEVEL